MSENKSVSELAKELGVTRQAVYNRVKQLSSSLQPFTVKIDNKTLYTLQGQKLIKQAFSSSQGVKQSVKLDSKEVSSVDSKLIDTLTAQLTVKDKQIEALTEQLQVKDKQIESLLESLKAAQLLHAAEKQPPKVIEVQPQENPKKPTERTEEPKRRTSGGERQQQRHSEQPKSRKPSFLDRLGEIFKR